MIGLDPRRALGATGWAESYEAKCERRQETRESRRWRPNVTTCRQVGKALRTQQREQLRRARQLQFFRRRNLEVEEKSQAQCLQAKKQGHSRRAGQTAVFKESLSCSKRITAPEQQVGHIRDTLLCGGGANQAGGRCKVTSKRFMVSSFFPSLTVKSPSAASYSEIPNLVVTVAHFCIGLAF